MMTKNMGEIYKEFRGDDQLRFISVTVNPENDSPDILKKYSNKMGVDFKNWIFLTGSREAIQQLVVGSFKLGDIKEPVFHSSYFTLVDRQGRLRGYYDGTDSQAVQRLIKDIVRLRKER
jgi:protein SCO1/2